jgi:energy-coupling factor transporter ATP-binding protein EcfA2
MNIDPISLKLAEIVLKWAWDKGTNQIDKINFKDPVTRAKLARACQTYIGNYRYRYGKISVLGMPKPAELENIYTNVQIIEGRNLVRYESQKALEQAYRDASKRSYQSNKYQKQDGICIANKHQYLMVLGQPGAGKSTFLKKIGLVALQGKEARSRYHVQNNLPGLQPRLESNRALLTGSRDPQVEELYIHELLPVLIELKRCDSDRIDLVNKIQAELEICGFESAEILTQTLLSKGGMLILLDGLDEIPSQHLNRAITQIQDFVNKYKDNRFIISCRTAAYQGGFNNLINVEMADFDDEQIQQFINNWFCQEQDLDVAMAEACWQLLNANGYQSTKELAHTPLLLTFLCLVYDESSCFPKHRAALYKDALDILLRRWAAEKRIQRDPIYKDLTIQLEEMLLAKIAYEQFSLDRLFFEKREIIREVCEYIAENLNAPKHLDGENVLRAIQIQQGILVERSSSTLSFSHLTLQEYLTAQYIVDRHLIGQMVVQHLMDLRWREVFLLVAGLKRNGADNLLGRMAVSSSRLIHTSNSRHLINWVEETTKDVQSEVNSLTQRNLALLIIYAFIPKAKVYNRNFYSYIYNNSDDINYCITNIYNIAMLKHNSKAIPTAIASSNNLIDKLSKLKIFNHINYADAKSKIQSLGQQIPEESQADEEHVIFAKNILQFWCQILIIDLEWLDLSSQEISNLEQYFTTNSLIMECKEAALYLSAKGWSEVEKLMFRWTNQRLQ